MFEKGIVNGVLNIQRGFRDIGTFFADLKEKIPTTFDYFTTK